MKILLVDDDPTVLEALEAAFRPRGHTTLRSLNLASAMRALRVEKVDALIADGLLPVSDPGDAPLSSWGILLALFAQNRGITALLLTGYDEIAEEARRARIPVLRKPIKVEELVAAVEGKQP